MPIGYQKTPVLKGDLRFAGDGEKGIPSSSFNAALYKPEQRNMPLLLNLLLRVDLQAALPIPITISDSEGKSTTFRPSAWSLSAWKTFLDALSNHASHWSRRLWLIPHASIDDYDERYSDAPGKVWRPNISCDLTIQWDAAADAADKVVQALYLDPYYNEHGGSRFRNSSKALALYNDEEPGTEGISQRSYTSDFSKQTPHMSYAHEIGHWLGLGHIGVIMDTRNCELALAQKRLKDSGINISYGFLTDLLTENGDESDYCYGIDDLPEIATDIMGVGTHIGTADALPWQRAIVALRKRPIEFPLWRVVGADPGPGRWITS